MNKTMAASLRRAAARLCALAAGLMVCAAGGAAKTYGAESSVVESVAVTFKNVDGEAGLMVEPEITVQGKGYSLLDVQYRTEPGNWKPGKKVRVEITLVADSGKYFPTALTRAQCKVSGADYVSARGLDDNKLQVKADYKPVMVLASPASAGWSNTDSNRAVWKSVDYATGYSLTLYGDNKVVKRLTVTSASADLTEYMRDIDKTYFYEVKAIPTTSDEKKYLKESELTPSTSQEYGWDEEEASVKDGGGIKKDQYILPDGSKEVNTWKKVAGQWYYFDGNGQMAKGWQFINGMWYYMDQNGVMKKGWVNPSGTSWFYLSENGNMLTGWIQPAPSAWYYLDSSGSMLRNWQFINGRWYFLGDDGKMRTGWVQISGTWYYFWGDGGMAVNTTVDGWNLNASGAASR